MALHWFAWVAAVPLASCAPGGDLPTLPDIGPIPYRLGVGDEIRIIVVGGDQLNGDFRIDDAGTFALPLIGNVPAAGLTTGQLSQDIVTTLRRQNLFRDPSVSIEIRLYRPIFILGEVSKPGQYPYQPGMTLLTAVSVAGGFTYRAVTDYAAVVRSDGTAAVEGRVDRQSFIHPGDVITIFQRWF